MFPWPAFAKLFSISAVYLTSLAKTARRIL
jgi:hypothetical protein